MTTREQLLPKINSVFEFAETQLRNLIEFHPNQFPIYTTNGCWDFSGESWTNWCEGFLGGQLWLIYQQNEDPWWREKAEHYSRLIEHRKTDQNVHDLGFLFWSTYKRWYDLSGDPALHAVLVAAGTTMSRRFMDAGEYLRSFLAANSLFIDIMMNVGIVFYAGTQNHDREIFDRAMRHCLTTRRYLVRGDGSTAHEGIFDLETGEFLYQSTQQGWRNDSAWARGLAWALYGFGTAYDFTDDARFLQTAEACANYYIEHTDESGVPPNDWDEPNPIYPYESSAAAIAASGFWNLSKMATNPVAAIYYRQYALKILETLIEPEFLAIQTSGWQGLLKHGIYHQNKGLGVDESVMWGDYFLLEALSKVKNDE